MNRAQRLPHIPWLSRRGFLLACTVVALESAFYAAVAPLAPSLRRDAGLSPGALGILIGAYPIGMLLGTGPTGVLAARGGPGTAVRVGLLLVAASSLWFAFAGTAGQLEVARLIQGIGGAFCWNGSLIWAIESTPRPQQAAAMGTIIAAGVTGVLAGPILGLAAAEAGREIVFGGVAAVSAALIGWGRPLDGPTGQGLPFLPLLHRILTPEALSGVWLTLLCALVIGALSVLVPLRFGGAAGGPVLIAAVFVAGGVGEAIAQPLGGHITDREGPRRFLIAVLAASAVLLVAVSATDVVALGAIGLVLLITSAGALLTPATAILVRVAERRLLPAAVAATAGNVAWAVGEALGAQGSGWLARSAAPYLPYLLLAGLSTASAIGVWRGRLIRQPSPASSGDAGLRAPE